MKDFLARPKRRVFFFDEGRFGLKPTLGRYWALKGSRPVERVNPGYENFYVYSCVPVQQGEAFSFFLPWVNTAMMNLYLKELSKAYPNQELLLIWDQAGWHQAKALRLPANIRVEPLPPYSPELNPTERLWRWLRRHVCRNRLYDSEDTLMDALTEALRTLLPDQLARLCHCGYLDYVI